MKSVCVQGPYLRLKRFPLPAVIVVKADFQWHKMLSLEQVYSFNIIGVGTFRILGGQGLEYWGAKGGPNSQQAHDVVLTSMRRNDVASTSFRRHVPTRFLINQCQIITFFILKSDRKFKRIERNTFASTFKSN